jgi:hypothetical protein
MSVLCDAELNEDESKTTSDLPVSSSNSLTWTHKALFLGVIIAGVVAFRYMNKSRSGDDDDDDEKTKD